MGGDRVSRFVAGDREVVDEIRSAITAAVRRFRPLASDAEDELTREALGRVFLGLAAGRFRGEASLETFAASVAKFTCIEQLRRRRADTSLDTTESSTPSPAPTPEEALLRDEKYRLGLRAVSSLPGDCVELIHLVFVMGMSYHDVAARLGINEAALRVRLHRCRARLAQAVNGERSPTARATSHPADAAREGTTRGSHE